MSSAPVTSVAILLNLALLTMWLQAQLSHGCEVSVETPWEEYTHITEDSEVLVSCSKEGNQTIAWAIHFPNAPEGSVLRFGFQDAIEMLNRRGFYQLPPTERDGISTIRLLINNTDPEKTNGTTIICFEFFASNQIYNQTTLIVDDPVSVRVNIDDMALQSANITVSSSIQRASERVYMLTVSSKNTNTTMYKFQSDSYTFTAPEDAPPCEVYNFSVTATYVGATYSGEDCGGSSTVISRMLPSLPDKERLESTLNYSLSKSDANAVTITVSVEDTSHYCETYPVVNYTLITENAFDSSERWIESMKPMERLGAVNSLPENGLYVFRIVASNAIGLITTENMEIYTTDVQEVTAIELRDFDAFQVGCQFIGGSNARGCMVIFVGDLGNSTMVLNKGVQTMSAEHPTSCYRRVIAYDIEEDGSVGRLAVPGKILSDTTSDSSVRCLPRQNTTSQNMNMVLIVAAVIAVLIITALCTFIITCIIFCRLKKQSRFKTVVRSESLDELPAVVAPSVLSAYSPEPYIPVYESPRNLTVDTKMSLSEDDDYDKLRQHEDASLTKYHRNDYKTNARLQQMGLSEDDDYDKLRQHDEGNLTTYQGSYCKTNAMLQEKSFGEDDDYDELQERDERNLGKCQGSYYKRDAILQEPEHFYHVLESGTSKLKPTVAVDADYELPEYTPPIYQEVSELYVNS